MDSSRGFAARRPAASNLPNFQLPAPDLGNKYSYAPQPQLPQSAPQNVASVLTPPVALGSEGVNAIPPVPGGLNSASSQNSSNGAPTVYNPLGYWPPQQGMSQQYPLSSGPPMPSPFAQNQNNMFVGRQLYSPTSNNYSQQNRNNSATSAEENLPQPPYQLNLPPFPTGASSGGQGPMSLANLSQQGQQSQTNQQHGLQNQSLQEPQQQQQQAMQNSNDQYGPRPPPTPTYSYGSSSTPQQPTFPAFTQAAPSQHSPITSGAPSSRISPLSATHPSTMHPPPNSNNLYRPFNNTYSLPGLSNQMMQNSLHNHTNQSLMMGQVGVPMPGYAPMHNQQMFGMHAGPPGNNTTDKPCKCDQCPQSFNRNHDLKRHQRIHLAVKPFPCEDCDKRFSRKDALKRHMLVKGCGKSSRNNSSESTSTLNKKSTESTSDILSDSQEESPVQAKKDMIKGAENTKQSF